MLVIQLHYLFSCLKIFIEQYSLVHIYTYLMIYTHKKDFIFNQVTNQGYEVSAGEEQGHECNSVIITHVLSVIPQTS